MITTHFAAMALVLASQQDPDLTTLVRATLAQCVAGPQAAVSGVLDVSDADWARPFRNDRACGLVAQGWTGDDGTLVAAARAAIGAEGSEWTGVVREHRVNESGAALWTQLEQAEGWAPAVPLIVEPPAGQAGQVEIHFDPAG